MFSRVVFEIQSGKKWEADIRGELSARFVTMPELFGASAAVRGVCSAHPASAVTCVGGSVLMAIRTMWFFFFYIEFRFNGACW